MKKTIILLLIIVCSFSAFAYKNEVEFKYNLMSIQYMTAVNQPESTVVSKCDIGSDLMYKRFLVQGLFVECGLSLNTYILPEDRPNLTSLLLYGGVGYKYNISESVNFESHIAIGADTMFYSEMVTESISIKAGVDFGINLDKNVVINIGCDGTVGFSQKEDNRFVRYRILPIIGTTVKF